MDLVKQEKATLTLATAPLSDTDIWRDWSGKITKLGSRIAAPDSRWKKAAELRARRAANDRDPLINSVNNQSKQAESRALAG